MKDIERVESLNKIFLNARVIAYGAIVDLIKKTGRLDLDIDIKDPYFRREIRVFLDKGLVCLSITSIYLSGEDNLMVDGYDEEYEKFERVNVYYDQISEIVYLAKIILKKKEKKDYGENG